MMIKKQAERKTVEAKRNINSHDRAQILGIEVVSKHPQEVISEVVRNLHKKDYSKPFFVVTAYSEFFLEAEVNEKFRRAIKKADMVMADGVSVWQAIEYLRDQKRGWWGRLGKGMEIGVKTLKGQMPERLTGVRLTEGLLELGVQNKYKVFLLGGWNRVGERLAQKWREKGLEVEWEEGFVDVGLALKNKRNSEEVIRRINRFQPDLLFVSFGRYKQEQWIAQQLENLHSGVVMGVGSSFDELAGEGVWKDKVPGWVEKRGLKWLWRVGKDFKHIVRAWRAAVVFPWKVFRSKRD